MKSDNKPTHHDGQTSVLRLVRHVLGKMADYEENLLGWGRPMLDWEKDLPSSVDEACSKIDDHVIAMGEALNEAHRDLERKASELKTLLKSNA